MSEYSNFSEVKLYIKVIKIIFEKKIAKIKVNQSVKREILTVTFLI